MSTPDPARDPDRPVEATTRITPTSRGRSPLLWLALLLVLALLAWVAYSKRNVGPVDAPFEAPVDATPALQEPSGPAVAPLGDGGQRTERMPMPMPRPQPDTARVDPPEPTPVLAIEGRNPKPPYPPDALRRQIGGMVVLRVDVDATGVPSDVDFALRSGDKDLDRAALDTVKQWRFTPATRNGKPVAAVVEVPVEFKPTDP